jgi:hypothetical protein
VKVPFRIPRQSWPHSLTAHRWDRVYQLLLRWSKSGEPEHFVPRSHQMEVAEASGNLCPSINATASTIADHRAATLAVARLYKGRRQGAGAGEHLSS